MSNQVSVQAVQASVPADRAAVIEALCASLGSQYLELKKYRSL